MPIGAASGTGDFFFESIGCGDVPIVVIVLGSTGAGWAFGSARRMAPNTLPMQRNIRIRP